MRPLPAAPIDRKTLCAPVLLSLLLLSGVVRAQEPSTEPDERLVEGAGPDGLTTNHRLACGGRFCVWSVTESLGPCFVGTCYSTHLLVTDRKGKPLGASSDKTDLSDGRARFVGPRQVEFVGLASLEENNGDDPDGRRREVGFGAAMMWRRLITLAQDGSKITSDTREPLSPKHHALLERRLEKQRAPAEPKSKGNIPETVLTKARALCDAEGKEGMKPTLYECHGGGVCVLVLDKTSDSSSSDEVSCALTVKNGNVEHLELGTLLWGDPQPYVFSLDATRYCFTCTLCGFRGSRGGTQCISRERPDHMAFVETAGLHVDSAQSYPVQRASSASAGAAAALTVHAYTVGHVSWGLDNWRDAKDLSLAWQAMRVGEELLFQVEVEVEDELLQPAGDGPAVHSDHLELDFTGPRAHLKLGVLLAAEGKVQLRLWKRGAGTKAQEVDEPYAASGTWSKTERGYRVEVSLPLAPLREALGDTKTYGFAVVVSDADEKKRQETLLENNGSLDFWDEYPPTLQEYNRVRARY